MKAFSLIVVVLLATTAGAAEPDSDAPSTPTRAAVRQETLRAIAAGEMSFGDVERRSAATPARGKTRAEVREDVRAAIAAGELRVGDIDPQLFPRYGAGDRGPVAAADPAAQRRVSAR